MRLYHWDEKPDKVSISWKYEDFKDGIMRRIRWPRACAIAVLSFAVLAGCSRDPNTRKQKFLESGNQYFDAGKYAEASIQYQNAIQVDPKFAEAHYKLAQAFVRRGIWTGAYQELMK